MNPGTPYLEMLTVDSLNKVDSAVNRFIQKSNDEALSVSVQVDSKSDLIYIYILMRSA